MYAVICDPNYWKEIEDTIKQREEDIIFKQIDSEVDIISELDQISRIAVKHLIIDISVLEENKIIQAIRRYRIKNDKTQIIIIAPNCLPGNEIIHAIVSMGIYNIIAPQGEDKLGPLLEDVLNIPRSYKKAVRWVLDEPIENNKKVPGESKRNNESKSMAQTTTITKEKIVGTVVIACAGTMSRIGTTHAAITIAEFLKNNNFSVALKELYNSTSFTDIEGAYEDSKDEGDYYSLDGLDFYPYTENLSVLDVLERDYNYIVLDMGIYKNCNIEEFKRANSRLIVSGTKDWEIKNLQTILETGDTIHKNKYLFNYSDEEMFDFIRGSMDRLICHKLPYNPNPFNCTKDCFEEYKKILKDVLPSTLKSKSSSGNRIVSSIMSKFKK